MVFLWTFSFTVRWVRFKGLKPDGLPEVKRCILALETLGEVTDNGGSAKSIASVFETFKPSS
jgi:hypothetical protein